MRVALLVFLLAACQTPVRYAPPNGDAAQLTLRVEAPFDTVWQAVIETFAEATTSIETLEKASGYVAAARPLDFTRVDDVGALVDFGVLNGIWASSYLQANPSLGAARARYNVLVVRGDATQQVRVNCTWSGQIGVESAGQIVRVELTGNSAGIFERTLLDAIAKRLPNTPHEIVESRSFRASTFTPPPRRYGAQREEDGWIREGEGR